MTLRLVQIRLVVDGQAKRAAVLASASAAVGSAGNPKCRLLSGRHYFLWPAASCERSWRILS
jgi:hypothetical protein